MEKKYCVLRIEEPDFGCEGRPEGQAVMDRVFLREDGVEGETVIFMEDSLLYEREIAEGTFVRMDESGSLWKLEDFSE